MRNIFLLLLLMVFGSCVHRPLEPMNDVHFIRAYVERDIRNVDMGFYSEEREHPTVGMPQVVRAALFDPQSGELVAERYLQTTGHDSKGYYLQGYIAAHPGNYKLLLYNFDTEATHIANKRNFFRAAAYTDNISGQTLQLLPRSFVEPENIDKIKFAPDHLFSCATDVVVPYTNGVDSIKTINGEDIRVRSLVNSYYIQVKIKGARYLSNACATLSGMSEAVSLDDGRISSEESVSILFEMQSTKDNEDGVAYLYSTFNSFGKIPDESSQLNVDFHFITYDGSFQEVTFDISEVFRSEDAIQRRWLIVDKEIEITAPLSRDVGGGGMNPSVDDWKDIEESIII